MEWLKRQFFLILASLLESVLGILSQSTFILLISRLVSKRGDQLSNKDRMRFLFQMEDFLMNLRNQAAMIYEGGIHPKHRLMQYHDFFTDRTHQGEHVLDIGCGIGVVANDIAERSDAFVLGMDIDEENIAQAKKMRTHPKIEYRVGDALKDLPAESFDVVVLSNVLEHLDGRIDFLRQVQRIANPKRLLIRVPLYERDWQVPLRRELGMDWRLDSTHVIEYTLKDFNDEMADAGLQVREMEIRWGEIWAEVIPNDA